MKDDHSGIGLRECVDADRDKVVVVTAYLRWGKRLFDVIFAAVALVLVSPIIAVVWLIVSSDGGQGFYGQQRIGKGRRVFTCWKLRSMVVDADAVLAQLCASDAGISAEWEHTQKLANDPRVTRVGRFIRKTRVDELPQLWNVLIGDMSIVGPRPFTQEQLQLYLQAGGSAYFGLRPGVTGPWQVAPKKDTDLAFVARVSFDDSYANKAHFWGDIGIILKTILTVFRMNGQ